MERLTEHCGRYIKIKGCETLYGQSERKSAPMSSAIVRLATYEDTGLMPEEIEKIHKEYGRGMTLKTFCSERLDIIKDIPTDVLWEAVKQFRGTGEPPNDQLTLDELRDMVGEPVWVKSARSNESGWALTGVAICNGLCNAFYFCDYGKTWIAYRRKPEEVEQ